MTISPEFFPALIQKISDSIDSQAEAITELDQAIGDGDHVLNLQRGLQKLIENRADICSLPWPAAWQKIGMLVMSAVGGASGSLYATLFLSLHKQSPNPQPDVAEFAKMLTTAVDAVKQRGKADVGEKTLLDVLVPVAETLQQGVADGKHLPAILDDICRVAAEGAEATRDMLATKGRASFLGERSLGHIDAGAKTAQIMITVIAEFLKQTLEASNQT